MIKVVVIGALMPLLFSSFIYSGNASILCMKTDFSDGQIPSWLHVTHGSIQNNELKVFGDRHADILDTSPFILNGSAVSPLYHNPAPKNVVMNQYHVNISIPDSLYSDFLNSNGYTFYNALEMYDGGNTSNLSFAIGYITISSNSVGVYNSTFGIYVVNNNETQENEVLWSGDFGKIKEFDWEVTYTYASSTHPDSGAIFNIKVREESSSEYVNTSALMYGISIPYDNLTYKETAWIENNNSEKEIFQYEVTSVSYLISYLHKNLTGVSEGNNVTGGSGIQTYNFFNEQHTLEIGVLVLFAVAVVVIIARRR